MTLNSNIVWLIILLIAICTRFTYAQNELFFREDWQVFNVKMSILTWRSFNPYKIEAGNSIEKPDLQKVKYIGWTDLTIGKGSNACTRLDWLEVYGKSVP